MKNIALNIEHRRCLIILSNEHIYLYNSITFFFIQLFRLKYNNFCDICSSEKKINSLVEIRMDEGNIHSQGIRQFFSNKFILTKTTSLTSQSAAPYKGKEKEEKREEIACASGPAIPYDSWFIGGARQ